MNEDNNQSEFCKQLLAQNITSELPEFKTVYNHMMSISSFIQDALDYGHQEASQILKSLNNGKRKETRKRDPWAYSVLLRLHVQTYLKERQVETTHDEEVDSPCVWDIESEPNLGLAGIYNGRNYRIIKGRGGQLPSLGLSVKRKKYYKQDHLLNPYLIPNDDQLPFLYNVIFLWDIDRQNFINLYLSCPRGCFNNIAYDYFTEKLPHPATIRISTPVVFKAVEETEDIVVERISELQSKLL